MLEQENRALKEQHLRNVQCETREALHERHLDEIRQQYSQLLSALLSVVKPKEGAPPKKKEKVADGGGGGVTSLRL